MRIRARRSSRSIQNCIVYNDGVFDNFAEQEGRTPTRCCGSSTASRCSIAKGAKGLKLNRQTLALEVVAVPDGNVDGLDILVHDETNRTIAQLLLDMPSARSRSRSG